MGKKNNKKKKKTKVQQRFADREAAGLDGHTGLRKVTDAERKEGKTQLTQYRQHQQQTIRDNARKRNTQYQAARNPVTPGMTTQQMVDRDNKVYGDTVPSGSFGISASGQAQAAANRADYASKQAAQQSSSEAERIAAEQAASRERDRRIAEAQAASRERDRQIAEAKAEAERENARIRAAAEAERKRKAEEERKRKAEELRQRRFDIKRLDPEPVNEISFEAPKTSEPQTAFDVQAPSLTAMQVPEKLPTNIFTPVEPKKESDTLTDRLTTKPASFTDSLLGISPARSEDISTNLNIKSDTNADADDQSSSRLGRALTFGKNLIQQPKAALAYGVDVANQLFSPRLGDGTLTGNQDFAGRLPGDEGFDMRDVQLKSAFNNAMDSRFVQQAGENIGLPSDFKAQTKDQLAALGENFKGATADRDGIYKGTSETLKNLTLDSRNAPLAKFITESLTDNPELSNTERFKLFGLNTPLSQERAGDLIGAFQKDTEPFTGLSREERGLIEGGAGNRIISGKLTDMAREAITGDRGTGDSLGLQQGTPLSISNMIDAGRMTARNVMDSGTLASRRASEIARLGGGQGKLTTPSLIKGLLPKIGRGGIRSKLDRQGGSGPYNVSKFNTATPAEGLAVPQAYNFGQDQSGINPETLSDIQQNAYNTALNSYGVELQQPPTDVGTQFTPAQTRRFSMDPEYFAQFRQRPRKGTRGSFRKAFIRKYF